MDRNERQESQRHTKLKRAWQSQTRAPSGCTRPRHAASRGRRCTEPVALGGMIRDDSEPVGELPCGFGSCHTRPGKLVPGFAVNVYRFHARWGYPRARIYRAWWRPRGCSTIWYRSHFPPSPRDHHPLAIPERHSHGLPFSTNATIPLHMNPTASLP